VLFHSIFGLRAVELAAAERLRATGCQVVVPDLFDGATVPGDVDAGSALMDQVGWGTIVDRACRGVAGVLREAVLGGFSMGVGVIGELWRRAPRRRRCLLARADHRARRCPCGHASAVACCSGRLVRSGRSGRRVSRECRRRPGQRHRCTNTVPGTSSPTSPCPTTAQPRPRAPGPDP
jgi:dienelactone hydrolase